jgi:predicted RNA binding protein YcfA (HicA-like mRNA interferase family)
MKVKNVIKMIEAEGWFMVRRKGSHRQYKHADKKGLVTIAGNLNDEIARGTLNSILKQSGLKYGREKSAPVSDRYRKVEEKL